MKSRWIYIKNKHGFYNFVVCYDYPNCKCDGHFVYEKKKFTHKTSKDGGP